MSVRKMLGIVGYLVFILAILAVGDLLYVRFFERLPPLQNDIYLQMCAPTIHQVSSVDGLHYELKPHALIPEYMPGISLKINARGMRNDEIPLQKKKFRVLVMGDSVAFGSNVKQEQLFTEVAQRFMAQRSIDAEVINAGVSAYNTRQEYLALCAKYLDLRPDLIVFAFCVNDATESAVLPMPKSFSADIDNTFIRSGYRNVTRPQYLAVVLPRQYPLSYGMDRWLMFHSGAYRALSLLRFKAVHHLRDFSSLPNFLFGGRFDETLGDIKALEARLHVPVRFLILPANTQWDTTQIMRAFRRHRLVTWDLDQMARKSCQGRCDYWFDEVHLKVAGHRMVGEFLAKRLMAFLPAADAAARAGR